MERNIQGIHINENNEKLSNLMVEKKSFDDSNNIKIENQSNQAANIITSNILIYFILKSKIINIISK